MSPELRPPGCKCHWEQGDSPCPVHGVDINPKEQPARGGVRDTLDDLQERLRGVLERYAALLQQNVALGKDRDAMRTQRDEARALVRRLHPAHEPTTDVSGVASAIIAAVAQWDAEKESDEGRGVPKCDHGTEHMGATEFDSCENCEGHRR